MRSSSRNIVKCRPPDNRDPEPDEIRACAPYLTRQLEALDPALVVTLGRYSLGRFNPGARIGQVHGTFRKPDASSGAPNALAFFMYHPAAGSPRCLGRGPFVPGHLGRARALLEARKMRGPGPALAATANTVPPKVAAESQNLNGESVAPAADSDPTDQLDLF